MIRLFCACCAFACAMSCATIRSAIGPSGEPDSTSAIAKAGPDAWAFYGRSPETQPTIRLVTGSAINCTGQNGGPGFMGEALNEEKNVIEPTCLGGLTVSTSSVSVADYGQPPWQSSLCHELRHVVMMYLFHFFGQHSDPLFDKDFVIEKCNAMLEAKGK